MIYYITGTELIFWITLGIFFGIAIGQESIRRKYKKISQPKQEEKE